ncbi:hypothetical protein BGW42_003416 [Actinomortierella wolfii]|nr:hypothetical protein BGW42_003416 [Actinomortierella wolfii]
MLLVKSLAVFCSAGVVLAQSTKAVSSGAIFSRETTHTTDPIQVFKDPENHLTALASIVVFAAETTSFKPAILPPKSLDTSLDDFINKVATFPGFILSEHEQGSIRLDSSLIQLEKAVRELVPHHGALVGRGIRDLFPGYIPDPTLNEWTLLLIGGERLAENDDIKLHLFALELKAEIDKSYTTQIPKQVAAFSRSTLHVRSSFLIANAQKLAEMIPIYSVHDAIDFLASPKVIPSDEDDSWSFTCHKDASVFDHLSKQRILAW